MSDPRRLIAQVRDGGTPQAEELRAFAVGLATGAVSDAQAGAFAMAVVLRGLSEEARVALTLGMRDSGQVLRWDLPGPVIDKHSTGGVGDSVSLILAPALALCGVYVPMISGRGLGHTGGTLDKLQSIPSLRIDLDQGELQAVLRTQGCAIVAATDQIAPADRRLYAIRDISGTVESLDLITASILSKKLAAGLEALVLDVKVGSGAFMATKAEAEALARALVATANGAGCKTSALITDMDQPLGRTAGNALEISEVVDLMTGRRDNARLRAVTLALGAEVLLSCGRVRDLAEGEAVLAGHLASGAVAERFAQMIAAQGGQGDILAKAGLATAPVVLPVTAPAGYVAAIQTRQLGEVVVDLGGGRRQASDPVDPRVGLSDLAPVGAEVGAGQPLAVVHAADQASAARAVAQVRAAYRLSEEPVRSELPLVQGRIG